jgi:hypothetical protein
MSTRPKRRSSAGVQALVDAVRGKKNKPNTEASASQVPAPQAPVRHKTDKPASRAPTSQSTASQVTAAQIEEKCATCGESDSLGLGSECHSCRRKMHHFCSHDVCTSLNIIENGVQIHEFRDKCFCSKECYHRSFHQDSQTSTNANVAAFSSISTSARTTTGCNAANSTSRVTTSLLEHATEVAHALVEEPPVEPSSSPNDPNDPLLLKMVAFCPLEEPWMNKKLYRSVGSTLLIGTVTRLKIEKKTGETQYQVIWCTTDFQSINHIHYLNGMKIREGVERYERCTGNRFPQETWSNLCRPENFLSEDLEDLELVSEEFCRFEPTPLIPESAKEVEAIKQMQFDANCNLDAPTDLFMRSDGSTGPILREEYTSIARHSASSCFFMYLPVAFWQMVAHATSENTRNSNLQEVTLEELMKFLGILFYMTIVDKGEYSNYWGPQVYSCTILVFCTY